MEIITQSQHMQRLAQEMTQSSAEIGFVPTMGSLHPGHLSLLERAKKENDVSIVSIFVNPSQFNNPADLSSYPRTLATDIEMCAGSGADYVFAPEVGDIYPPGFRTQVEVPGLGDVLCGEFRPGHFRGVATIVSKLFNIVLPRRAYFGEKDWQQCAVILRMVQDLSCPVSIVTCPTLREQDGLAMSSRNKRLSAEERLAAAQLPELLFSCREYWQSASRNIKSLREKMAQAQANTQDIQFEYFRLINGLTLEDATSPEEKLVMILAAQVGRVRLIDNLALN